jgi:hypothetical protein
MAFELIWRSVTLLHYSPAEDSTPTRSKSCYHQTTPTHTNNVQDFPTVLGKPNAVLTGLCQSCPTKGASVSALLLVSSPKFNATTGQLTFSATKLPGWNAGSKVHLGDASNILLDSAQLVIDDTEEAVNGAEEAGRCGQ